MALALSMEILQWLQVPETILFSYPYPLSVLLLIFLFVFFVVCFTRILRAKPINSPPSPPGLPIIGHLHLLGSLPHQSLRNLSHKYGPLMLLRLGFTPTLVVSSADMAREIMKSHDVNFSNRAITTAANIFFSGGKDMVFAPVGEHWRQARKICVLDLLSVKSVQSFRSVRDEEVTNMVTKIKQACFMREEVNLADMILGVTSNIMSKVALGRSLKELEGKSCDATKLITEFIIDFAKFSVEDSFPGLGWVDVLTGLKKSMQKTNKGMRSFFNEVIDEHILSKDDNAQSCRKDFVDILLEYEKDPSRMGTEFTREHVRLLLFDMFVAGTETTFVVLEWAMAELVNHPNVIKKLQEEVRRVVGTKSIVDEDDLCQMDYLGCVIKETLRLHPPLVLSLPRISTTSTNIQGYHIPAKTKVFINLWAIARDPKIWDRPDEFIPERFVNSSVDFRGKDFEFIPFGAGRRGCPGISFAIISAESILANLLYWFDWKFIGATNKGNVDMTEAFGITVRLKYPLHLVPISHFD